VLDAHSVKSLYHADKNVEVFPKGCHDGSVKASGGTAAFEPGAGSNLLPLTISTVLVARSSASVANDLAVFRTSTFAKCFATKLLSPRRLKHWTRLPSVTLPGGDAAGWRFTAGQPTAIDVDFTMCAVGRDEIFLESLGLTATPASATRRFLSLLAARAVANPH
jgi:hypothetical protein